MDRHGGSDGHFSGCMDGAALTDLPHATDTICRTHGITGVVYEEANREIGKYLSEALLYLGNAPAVVDLNFHLPNVRASLGVRDDLGHCRTGFLSVEG